METENKLNELQAELASCRHSVHEYATLLRSMELINSSIDLHTVLDYLMEVAKQITESDAASAILVEDDRLCFVAASGRKSSEVKKVYLEKGEGIAGWVAENGRELLIEDVEKDARFTRKVDDSSGFVTRSVIAVPLKMEDTVIGVVEAVNKQNGQKFTQNDVRLLSSLATSAAMAINKARLYADINELFIATIKAMANAIEAKDRYTRGHSERIRDYSLVIAREMGFDAVAQKTVEIAALLHDVGKIGVPEALLRKESKLTDDEFREVMKHPQLGAEMLSSIKQLKDAIPGIRYHQERYDGKGYPERLAGEQIPLLARIIAVADTFDAMTSDRAYRKAMTDEVALAELERYAGVQFDPECVRAFVRGHRKGCIISQAAAKTAGADGASAAGYAGV